METDFLWFWYLPGSLTLILTMVGAYILVRWLNHLRAVETDLRSIRENVEKITRSQGLDPEIRK